MLRQAICNEVFQDWKFHEACKTIRAIGYTGIEISPFTLSDNPAAIPANERRQFRSIIESEGLIFAGLHWLLVAPKGLHVTTPDKALREKSWSHIVDLIDLCADFGPDGVMVFGSPQQRSTTDGATAAEAVRRFTDGLAGIASHASQRHVTVLVEALPRAQSDIVNTLAEAVEIVKEIGSPAVRTMFDTHNAADETEPHEILIERYFDFIRHVHINEMDGRHPGTGGYDFKPVFAALERLGYSRWVSLEVFDFSAGAEKIAGDSLRYVESEIRELS